jgi:serine protease Do
MVSANVLLFADALFGFNLLSHKSFSQEHLKADTSIVDIKSLVLITSEDKASDPLQIARQITVRILTDPGMGSGVIVSHNGRKYTILTNEHVVSNTWDGRYKILTADGFIHQGKKINFNGFNNLDLAVIEFTSSRKYLVAKKQKFDVSMLEQRVYAAGFPNWYWSNPRNPISTRDWGLKSYKVTAGTIKIFLNRPLALGYRLGYTNDIENGMSGGPVINGDGYLIGINGRLKHPFNGINSYVFTDGSMPSQEQFLQMESLSWAIIPKMFQ